MAGGSHRRHERRIKTIRQFRPAGRDSCERISASMPHRVPEMRAGDGRTQPGRRSGTASHRIHQPAFRYLFRVQPLGRLHHGRRRSPLEPLQLRQPRLEMEVI